MVHLWPMGHAEVHCLISKHLGDFLVAFISIHFQLNSTVVWEHFLDYCSPLKCVGTSSSAQHSVSFGHHTGLNRSVCQQRDHLQEGYEEGACQAMCLECEEQGKGVNPEVRSCGTLRVSALPSTLRGIGICCGAQIKDDMMWPQVYQGHLGFCVVSGAWGPRERRWWWFGLWTTGVFQLWKRSGVEPGAFSKKLELE